MHTDTGHKTHTDYLHILCSLYSHKLIVFALRKWPQGHWINYSKLQVGVFSCQSSLSHTGEIVILPHELNTTANTDEDTHTNMQF